MAKRYILMGPPGVGKGSQAVEIAKHFEIPHISTGDIFRKNFNDNTELGKLAKSYIEKGDLVPDQLTCDIVAQRLLEPDCKKGFILDGFPRNVNQALFLDKFLLKNNIALNGSINLTADDSIIIKRLSGRRTCTKCGASFHIESKKSKVDGICDNCNTPLVIRKDDEEEVIKNRLQVYKSYAEDLITYYRNKNMVLDIDATRSIEEILQDIIKRISLWS